MFQSMQLNIIFEKRFVPPATKKDWSLLALSSDTSLYKHMTTPNAKKPIREQLKIKASSFVKEE